MPSQLKVCIGFDVGATTLAGTGVTLDAQPLLPGSFSEQPSNAHLGPLATIDSSIAVLRAYLEQLDIPPSAVVGVATTLPAPLDGSDIVKRAVNMSGPGWQGCPYLSLLKKEVEAVTGHPTPIRSVNDCDAGARREASLRPHVRRLAFLAPGTGLGGGYVVDQRLLEGARGMAAELGHAEIAYPAYPGTVNVPCGCGQLHCVESYASLAALQRILPQIPVEPGHPLHNPEPEDVECWKQRALLVRGLADSGDELARSIFLWQAGAIGALIKQIAVFYDPEVVVIGGGWLEVSDDFRDELLAAVRESFQRRVSFEDSKLISIEPALEGDLANALGAALYALDAVSGR